MKLFIFALLVAVAMASEYPTEYSSEYPTEKRHLLLGGYGLGGYGLGYAGAYPAAGFGYGYPGVGLGYGGVWKRETPRDTGYPYPSSFEGQRNYPNKRDVESTYETEVPTDKKRHVLYPGALGYGYGLGGYGGRFVGYGAAYPGFGLGYGGVWKRETPRETPYTSNFDGQTGYPTEKINKINKRDVESSVVGSYELPTEKRHLVYPGIGYGVGTYGGYGYGRFGYGGAYPGFGLGYGGVWKRETPRNTQYESNFDGQTGYPTEKINKRDVESSYDIPTGYPVNKINKRDVESSYGTPSNTQVPTEKRHLLLGGYGLGGYGLGLGYGAYPAAGYGLGYGYPGFGRGVLLK